MSRCCCAERKRWITGMYDWNDLRFFLELSRQGKLVRAATRLQVDHTTVSRRIAALEKELDVRLFDKSPRGYQLTDAGPPVVAAGRAHRKRIQPPVPGHRRQGCAARRHRARGRAGSAGFAGDRASRRWFSPRTPRYRNRAGGGNPAHEPVEARGRYRDQFFAPRKRTSRGLETLRLPPAAVCRARLSETTPHNRIR